MPAYWSHCNVALSVGEFIPPTPWVSQVRKHISRCMKNPDDHGEALLRWSLIRMFHRLDSQSFPEKTKYCHLTSSIDFLNQRYTQEGPTRENLASSMLICITKGARWSAAPQPQHHFLNNNKLCINRFPWFVHLGRFAGG